jgi:hypothetical protein
MEPSRCLAKPAEMTPIPPSSTNFFVGLDDINPEFVQIREPERSGDGRTSLFESLRQIRVCFIGWT